MSDARRKCTKDRYRDRIAAELALARVQRKSHKRERDPVRCYLCPACHGWHLTSMTRRT